MVRRRSRMEAVGRLVKRIFDVLVAAIAIVLLAPLLAGVAVAVRIALGKPVLLLQLRPGRRGEPFVVYKFRTMKEVHGPDGQLLPDEARLTRFGAALRSMSLDELPQLWNVLRGDMSIVGPRPLLMDYIPLYTPLQARRHEVRPGLTGWAQIRGRNALSWSERLRLDVWYVENRSFLLDLRIIFETFGVLVSRYGITSPGAPTVERFRGTSA